MQFPRLDPRRLILAEAIAAALALGACGGGGSMDEAEEPSDTAVESTVTTDSDPSAGVTAESHASDAVAAPDPAVADTPPSDTGDAAAAPDPAMADTPAGDAVAEADPIATGDTPAPEPQAGEQGFGSMEATSKAFEENELAQAGTPESEAAESESVDGSDRESAQYLTNIAGKTGYAKPKVAAIDYASTTSLDRKKLLAKFKLVIIGGRGPSVLNSFTSGIKSINPYTRIGVYVAFNELKCDPIWGNYTYTAVQEANKAGFWLRYANGTRTQWTSAYGNCDINISAWGKKNAAGQTWMQYKARYDYDRLLKNVPKVEYIFSDNTFSLPRVDADWKRIRTNQPRTDSTIIATQRQGQAAYWAAMRSLKSSVKIIGNANNDLSNSEYRYKLNGAMQEAAMGKSWSLETWAGWDKMMARYRGQIRNSAAPKDVFLEVRGSTTNYKLMRYGLASALLENGWFVHLPLTGTFQPKWFDEYEAPLGTPVESPPTAPRSNGIWMRKYQNGLVLVNPSKTYTRSIYIGTAYKRLKGTQDPYVNNGAYQSTVTLGPRQGLLMIKR
jgi:hypothetical protein